MLLPTRLGQQVETWRRVLLYYAYSESREPDGSTRMRVHEIRHETIMHGRRARARRV